MTFKVKVNDTYFSTTVESIPRCVVGLWIIVSYRAEEVKFMGGRADGRTGGRTDTSNDYTPSTWKEKG